MEYLTADEITGSHKDHARGILGNYSGRSVRDLFAIGVFKDAIKGLAKDKTALNVLDLGSARGTFAGQLADAGLNHMFGVDIDDYRAPEHRPVFTEFRIVNLSSDTLPWPDGFFDAAAAWCVLPHLENPFHCIREVHRVLRPGGVFVFSTPHLAARPSIAYLKARGDFASYRPSNNHIALLPPGVVAKTAGRYFDIAAVRYHVRPKIFSGGAKSQLRKAAYALATRFSPRLRELLEYRWATNAVYVLKKKSEV